jgi:hypothetical protein
LLLLALGLGAGVGVAFGGDGTQPGPSAAQAGGAGDRPKDDPKAPAGPAAAGEQAKLLAALREALERNAREVKALREQYAKDMEAQRRTVEAQQKQIEALQRSARSMAEQLQKRPEARAPADVPAAAPLPGAADGGAAAQKEDLTTLQQKQIRVLEEQVRLLAEQVEKQAPAIEKAGSKDATLESRSRQAAERDKELADSQDALTEVLDARQREPTPLPSQLKQWFLPSGTNVTPVAIWNTLSTHYDVFQNRKGAGYFSFQEYTPFFLVQLNKRFLLSAETTFTQSGVSLGQAQLDWFINNWLTADIGYFLAPIGFWSERLDPRWINKLPDIPLVMRQVIPDGLTLTGLQFRGATYIFRSPFKLEYSAYATNGLGVPGMGQAADFADLTALTGTTSGINNAMAYGGRLGIWIPSCGINFGASEFVNAPYSKQAGPLVSIWQPYFNYHYGNWDVRFEYGQNYERTAPFIHNNINRNGLYAQVAYRNYRSLHKHLQRLEYVFRFSDARFHGINQAKVDPTAFATPMDAPIDRNQYTVGLNYYFYPTAFLKFAYEINDELRRSLRDDVFMVQFTTNF